MRVLSVFIFLIAHRCWNYHDLLRLGWRSGSACRGHVLPIAWCSWLISSSSWFSLCFCPTCPAILFIVSLILGFISWSFLLSPRRALSVKQHSLCFLECQIQSVIFYPRAYGLLSVSVCFFLFVTTAAWPNHRRKRIK